MNKHKIIKFVMTAGLLLPSLTYAATIKSAVDSITGSLSGVPAVLIGIAMIYFLIGVFQYASGADEKTRGEARNKIAYGLIGIFVMTAMWGLVKEVQTIVGL